MCINSLLIFKRRVLKEVLQLYIRTQHETFLCLILYSDKISCLNTYIARLLCRLSLRGPKMLLMGSKDSLCIKGFNVILFNRKSCNAQEYVCYLHFLQINSKLNTPTWLTSIQYHAIIELMFKFEQLILNKLTSK